MFKSFLNFLSKVWSSFKSLFIKEVPVAATPTTEPVIEEKPKYTQTEIKAHTAEIIEKSEAKTKATASTDNFTPSLTGVPLLVTVDEHRELSRPERSMENREVVRGTTIGEICRQQELERLREENAYLRRQEDERMMRRPVRGTRCTREEAERNKARRNRTLSDSHSAEIVQPSGKRHPRGRLPGAEPVTPIERPVKRSEDSNTFISARVPKDKTNADNGKEERFVKVNILNHDFDQHNPFETLFA